MNVQGDPFATIPNAAVPNEYLWQVYGDMNRGLTFHEAVKEVRNSQVHAGYQPHPFRKNIDETLLDSLRSVLATRIYRYILVLLW